MIFSRPLTPEEEYTLYGDRKVELNKTFTKNGHLYLQRENDVLHINGTDCINSLHVGFLNDSTKDFKEIPYEKFHMKAKEIIYSLELDKFWDGK